MKEARVIWSCDNCKKEIEKGRPLFQVSAVRRYLELESSDDDLGSIDLCKDCYDGKDEDIGIFALLLRHPS